MNSNQNIKSNFLSKLSVFKRNIQSFSIFKFSNFQIVSVFIILCSLFTINCFAQNSLDQLQYNYTSNTNQLNSISDAIGSTISAVDLDNQTTNNYAYNATGQLTKDEAEGILQITWTASGKVKQVSIDDTEPKDGIADRTLQFKYDALGNRIRKIETFLTTISPQLTTYYLRNATGELISIYENNGTATNRTEVNNNGIGVDKTEENLSSSFVYERKVGNKNYALKDQLGNVRVTISDIKDPNPSLTTFNSQLTTSADYYSYGMLMSGRDYNSSDYRYGFNGKEKDDELKGNGNSYDFGARMLDPRVGRWLSIDPLAEKFPDVSPYNAMGNNPINYVDPDGRILVSILLVSSIAPDQEIEPVPTKARPSPKNYWTPSTTIYDLTRDDIFGAILELANAIASSSESTGGGDDTGDNFDTGYLDKDNSDPLGDISTLSLSDENIVDLRAPSTSMDDHTPEAIKEGLKGKLFGDILNLALEFDGSEEESALVEQYQTVNPGTTIDDARNWVTCEHILSSGVVNEGNQLIFDKLVIEMFNIGSCDE